MPTIRNISGESLYVPWLNGRLVLDEQTVEVPAEGWQGVTAYTQQTDTWEPADDEAQRLHDEMLDGIATLLAVEGETGAELVRLAEVVAAENDRDRPRTTVLAAAEKREAELTDAQDTPGDDDSQEG